MGTNVVFKVFYLSLVGFLSSCCSTRTINNTHKYPVTVTREFGVRGVIFPDTVAFWNTNIPAFLIGRFSPSLDDIFLFERIFHAEFIDYQRRWEPVSSTRVSPEKYSHWVRHYYGFYNEKGEKIISVVFIQLNRSSRKMWRKGSYFQIPGAWGILSNLDTRSLIR